MKKPIVVLLLVFISFNIVKAQSYNDIIPQPVSVIGKKGNPFILSDKVSIAYPSEFTLQSAYLIDAIKAQTGIALTATSFSQKNNQIKIIKDTGLTKPEQYLININTNSIDIHINSERSLVNATQTLLQLLPYGKFKTASINTVDINDYPNFIYRGMHLDVVRHIFPVSFIKKYIDYLAFHKFNTFHWHLTDDQGWRIEMDEYTKLNSIGSWRKSTLIGHFKDTPARYDSIRYGGFYTKTEIKEIIAYAKVRAIDIIPEIDIPGHSRAVIAAYPALSTKPDTSWEVANTWGMYNRQNNVLAPKPATFRFLESVFSELIQLFPSKYIHIGGDECSKIWWKQDTATQSFMKEHQLKNESALQTYFIEFVANFLKKNNRIAIGWHEINEGELDTATVVMNWGTDKQAIEAATKGFSVIQTPGKPLYFDHYQSLDPADSLAIHGYNPTEAVYAFDPIVKSLIDKNVQHKIMGAQANVWTEYMGNEQKVNYMIFPRMTALSETLWTPTNKKNYPDFLRRVEKTAIPKYKYWDSHYFTEYKKWNIQQAPKQ